MSEYIPMHEALRLNLQSPPLIPAVRVHGEIFSHSDGHDMAMDVACARYGDLHLSDNDFGYLSAKPEMEGKPCSHAHWSFSEHGRRCTCGESMLDAGD